MTRRALIAVVVVLRFMLPVCVLKFPFQAGWANLVLDSVDGDILVPSGLSERTYQRVDKSADYVTYVSMVAAGRRWPIRNELIALFGLRSIGQLLYFTTGDRRMLFWFPNFLEPLFLAYATIRSIKGTDAPRFFARHARLIWVLVIAYKLQDEWITHIRKLDRTDLAGRLVVRRPGT